MSHTITLPSSPSDHFHHGHTHSHARSNTRHSRSSGRLAPPFSLPRIPSESLHQHSAQHETHEDHKHTFANRTIQAPRFNPDELAVSKKRSFEVVQMADACKDPHQHRHVSKPTELLLHTTENYSLLHGILADHDSRRIFYFMILNLAFMVVQSTYGYLTGSLGLISDSIHMFFDCVALLVGVCAAVMSKWPPSAKFPYGYGKIDTLAGLGNGIFLMLISIEIVYEAVERLFTGADVSRTTELLVVSSVGLVVNFVGILAFHGHHHHGHDHGHAHDHGHGHKHEHEHEHEHQHQPSHDHASHHLLHKSSSSSIFDSSQASPSKNTPAKNHSHDHSQSHSHAHGHSHGSENMQGIYLHIMADALGSVAVVISTLLVKFTNWSGWDPIASCIIAILIFISTIPLIMSTTKILLLSLDSNIEYNLRDILGGLTNIRGVVDYSVPKFWLEDIKKESGHSHHHHDHPHSHSHHHQDSKDSDVGMAIHESPTALGVIHIIANQSANMADVRMRVSDYFRTRAMNVVIQVEREGEGRCFCAASIKPLVK